MTPMRGIRIKLIAAFVLGILLLGAAMTHLRSSAQQQPAPPDKYALLETAADFPTGWKLWSEHIRYYTGAKERGADPNVALDMWMGRTMDPGALPSPANKILAGADINMRIHPSGEAAWQAVKKMLTLRQSATPPVDGSYTGVKIGDRCQHPPINNSNRGASLWFVRGTVLYFVGVYGPSGDMDYPAVVERLALALVERTDAATILAATADSSVTVANRALTGKTPNGVAVVHVQDYADATGAAAKVDLPGGTVQITRGGHTLKVNIGRREAWFDGQPFILAFPALRHGKDQVYCPLDALKRLGS